MFNDTTMRDEVTRMLTASGDRCTIGAEVDAPCYFSAASNLVTQGDRAGYVINAASVLLEAWKFPNLVNGDKVTVNGVDYAAQEIRPIQDGMVLFVTLGLWEA